MKRSFFVAAALCAAGLYPVLAAADPSEFFPLGHLEGIENFEARDISDAGEAVGQIACIAGGYTAFAWRPGSGLLLFEPVAGSCRTAGAGGVSDDGGVVAGYVTNMEGVEEAATWDPTDGWVVLPAGGGEGEDSRAYGISGDGRVIVGAVRVNGDWNGVIWNEDGSVVNVGLLDASSEYSALFSSSADGSVVVGRGVNADRNFEAIAWSETGGLQGLGFLPGGTFSWARSVSANGEIIVGESRMNEISTRRGFLWTAEGGMISMGVLTGAGGPSAALGVSADGTIAVGYSADGQSEAAIIWTAQSGMLRLDDLLKGSGATGLDGWSLLRASAISANGQWLTGYGRNPDGALELWVARLDLAAIPNFAINAGLNDAWYNPATPGQGFFFNVFPDLGLIFLAWFTYDTERPAQDVMATLGEPGHRWLTAIGGYAGNTATLDFELTAGGVFNSVPPEVMQTPGYGTISVQFQDCSNATISYSVPNAGVSGEIPIQRIVSDNVPLCEALSAGTN